MKITAILFLIPFYTLIFLRFVPIEFRSFFPVLPLLSFVFGIFYFRKSILRFLDRNQFPVIIGLLAVVFLGSCFLIRWKVEPYGMWDSWANWSLKSKSITFDFILNRDIQLPVISSIRPEYPMGFPLFISFWGILLSNWSLKLVYTFSFLGVFFIVFIFLRKAKIRLLSFFGLVYIYSNNGFIQISSDLCADLPLSLAVLNSFVNMSEFNSTKKSNAFFLGLTVALPIIIKSEGILIFLVSLLLTIALIIHRNRNSLRMIVPQIICVMLGVFPPVMFMVLTPKVSEVHRTVDYSFQVLLNFESFIQISKEKIPMILVGFYQFHFLKMASFYIVSIFFLVFTFTRRLFFFGFSFLILIVGYNLVYLFSVHNLFWHLSTSYSRIHYVLLPVMTYLFILSYKIISRRMLVFIGKSIQVLGNFKNFLI